LGEGGTETPGHKGSGRLCVESGGRMVADSKGKTPRALYTGAAIF
jgi:hypothetical protein